MRKFLLQAMILLMVCVCANAQKLTIENVQKISLRSSGAIKEGTEVKGYYFFYVSDKIDKKTNEFTLSIHDENLTKLKDIKFTDSKEVMVLECSFNGSDLLFLFYNSKEKMLDYQLYGADGKKKFNYTREITKKEKAYLETTYLSLDDEEQTFKGLYPIEGKGFISNMPSREDKDYTFQIDFMGSDKRKQWTYIPTEGYKKFVGDFLGVVNGVVMIQVEKYKSMMDGSPDSYLLGLSLDKGTVLFEKPTDLPKYKFYPASLSLANGGKAYLYGEYFKPNDNIMKDKSLGFAFWEVDEKGTIKSEKYLGWEEGLGKYLTVSSKGKIDDFGYMFIHSTVQTADGNIYAIAEGYKKQASALGIATTLLTRGGSSVTKIKVTDMLIIKFDKDFNVKDAKIYDKNSNGIELPKGAEFASVTILGKFIKYYYGGFDYNYTQVNKDLTSFTVCYSDYERGKDYKGGTFNSITYNDGKFSTDKIHTKSDASSSVVLPGKQGQVLLMEYYKKAKKLEVHFEKLN
jgi:hypothetical protein